MPQKEAAKAAPVRKRRERRHGEHQSMKAKGETSSGQHEAKKAKKAVQQTTDPVVHQPATTWGFGPILAKVRRWQQQWEQLNAEAEQRLDAEEANRQLYKRWCSFGRNPPSTISGVGRLLAGVRVTQVQQHEMLKQHTDQLQQLEQHAEQLQQLNRKLDGLVLGGLAVLGLVLHDRRGGRRGGGRA